MVTRYLRDASGNVMSIYKDTTALEVAIYGSARLGMYQGEVPEGMQILGRRSYELSNHLGNVLTVITDNIGMESDSTWCTVTSTSDYYPFGLEMQGRSWKDTTTLVSRYGFNSKEKDDNGEFGVTHYDYGFRIYNPTIAKFLSVDPLAEDYPMLTPFQFASNTPIQAIDLDGLESKKVIQKGSEFLYTLYEWNGKNPAEEFIGIKNIPEMEDLVNDISTYLTIMKQSEPSYQNRILYPKLKKKLPFVKEDKIDWDYTPAQVYEEIRKMCYDRLGFQEFYKTGKSLGLDCSGFVNLAYSADKELEGGFTINGGSSAILNSALNSKSVIRNNGELAAIVFDNANNVSEADLVWQKDHIMIATGNVKKDDNGVVTEFEVIHSSGSQGVVVENIKYVPGKFKFIHPFRTSDSKKDEGTDKRWEESIKTKQWAK